MVKRLTRKNIALIALACFVSLVAGVGLKAYFFFNPAPDTIREKIQHDEVTGRINMVFVGLDEVPGETANRSDSIAFVSIDIDEKIVRLLSLPRDTRVQIPGHGWQKINHAYAYGGVELLKATLVNYLGVPIPYHVIVNFESFPQLVDMIGGVTLDIPKRLKYSDRAGNLFIDIPAGVQHMDGKTALGYVRFRHDALGDIGRVERQQIFLKAAFARIKEPGMVTRIPELLKYSLKIVKTNMSLSQSIQLASYMKDMDPSRTVFRTLPGKAAFISGISYWLGDPGTLSEFFSEIPEENPTEEQTDTEDPALISGLVIEIGLPVTVLNGSGTAGIGKEAATRFQSVGIDVGHIGNARHYDYRHTNILYPPGENNQKAAEALGKLTGIQQNLVKKDTSASRVTIIMGHDYMNVLKRFNSSSAR